MNTGNDVMSMQQATPAPASEVSLKEQFDKIQASTRVAEVEQPTLREVVSERSEAASKVVDILREVGEINAHISILQSSLQLSVDSASGRNVISVMDKSSGELIRTIPSREVLQMSARIRQYMESMQQQIQQGKVSDLSGLLYEGKG